MYLPENIATEEESITGLNNIEMLQTEAHRMKR